jgi:lysophospholipase L1-like esterase
MNPYRTAVAGLAVAAALLGGLVVVTGNASAAFPGGSVTASSRALPAPSPLRMAVLGDSIAWGQGLADQHKYSELVRGWLARRTGRPVALDVYAHSGAVLTGACTPAGPGELPSDTPSVACQLASAAASGHRYDLVLFSGCINDVGTDFLITGRGAVPAATRARCTSRLATALRTARALPGRPKVVVTGYYQIVSRQTSLRPFLGSLHLGLLAELVPSTVLRDAVTRTGQFTTTFDAIGRAAVASSPGSAVFVSPGFGPADALFAPGGTLWTGSDDEVAAERAGACRAAKRQPLTEKLIFCPKASLGHPDVAGAARYAAHIEDAIGAWFPAA